MKLAKIVLLSALILPLSGCPSSAYHNAVVAEHDAKSVVQAFQQAVIIEHTAGRISDAENANIETHILQVATAGQTLTTALQQGASQTTVLADLQVLVDAVNSLNTGGVLGIKNAQSQAALTAALNAIKAVLANVQTLLSAPTTEIVKGPQ